MCARSCGVWRLGCVYLPALLMVFLVQDVWGKVTGPCVNCHTMHNSQDGASVVDVDIGIQPALTTTNCVGCHTDATVTIRELNGSRVPIVYTVGILSLEPDQPNSMLAGGNFHWMVSEQDDTKGHNVYGLAEKDHFLNKAPGGVISAGGNSSCVDCHMSLATPKSGCKGCHLPAHHADDSALVVDADHGAYRFLGDVMANVPGGSYQGGRIGIKGIEDPDWEKAVTSSQHNVYSGTTLVYPQTYGAPNLDTIGQMCAGCHGNFHDTMNSGQNGGGNDVSGVWIRHPSDVLIPASGEYAAYTEYNPLAPVAKVALEAVSSVVVPGTDVVTCISCHRPHGSPYPDMLRWNYDSCVAGAGDTEVVECGCFVCHTAKDD